MQKAVFGQDGNERNVGIMEKPIEFLVTPQEKVLLDKYADQIARWGWTFSCIKVQGSEILIRLHTVPEVANVPLTAENLKGLDLLLLLLLFIYILRIRLD
jgi:hypothetical protein